MRSMMQSVTVDQLATLPEPKVLGPRHRPLHHHRFTQVIDEVLKDRGMVTADRDIEISHGGRRLFGTYRLVAPGHIRDLGDAIPGRVEPMLGFKNSNDQIFCGRIALAGRVFNCSNGMWLIEEGYGEAHHKNTVNAESQLREKMQEMVEAYWTTFEYVLDSQRRLAAQKIHNIEAHHLICEGQRQGITSATHAGRVLDAWHDEPFDWGEKSLWRLHNCHTYVLDREVKNPYVRSRRNLKLNGMIEQYDHSLG